MSDEKKLNMPNFKYPQSRGPSLVAGLKLENKSNVPGELFM